MQIKTIRSGWKHLYSGSPEYSNRVHPRADKINLRWKKLKTLIGYFTKQCDFRRHKKLLFTYNATGNGTSYNTIFGTRRKGESVNQSYCCKNQEYFPHGVET